MAKRASKAGGGESWSMADVEAATKEARAADAKTAGRGAKTKTTKSKPAEQTKVASEMPAAEPAAVETRKSNRKTAAKPKPQPRPEPRISPPKAQRVISIRGARRGQIAAHRVVSRQGRHRRRPRGQPGEIVSEARLNEHRGARGVIVCEMS